MKRTTVTDKRLPDIKKCSIHDFILISLNTNAIQTALKMLLATHGKTFERRRKLLVHWTGVAAPAVKQSYTAESLSVLDRCFQVYEKYTIVLLDLLYQTVDKKIFLASM